MADLAAAVGISTDELRQIWTEVKRNSARLRACQSHTFKPIGETRTLGQKYRCRNCNGTVDSIARSWYEEGRRHAAES